MLQVGTEGLAGRLKGSNAVSEMALIPRENFTLRETRKLHNFYDILLLHLYYKTQPTVTFFF